MTRLHRFHLFLLLIIYAVFHAAGAIFTDPGNDEVYYILYARYPDWSHFDHPPMVGWLIWLTTLGNTLTASFFIRLGAILAGLFASMVLFNTVKRISDSRNALFAVMLYHASIYFSIISGLFIMPDTMLVLFWTLAVSAALRFIELRQNGLSADRQMLLFGVWAGAALLSKYTAIFVWPGMLLYLLFFDRRMFLRPSLYFSGIISLLFLIPVLIWNARNNFISFTFHEQRVVQDAGIQWKYFFREMTGEVLYQSPLNMLAFIIAFLSVGILVKRYGKRIVMMLLLLFFPLFIVFPLVSLFRATLPHWNGPAWYSVIILAALLVGVASRPYRMLIRFSYAVSLLIIPLGIWVIQSGAGLEQQSMAKDFTIDMYGWRNMDEQFKQRFPEMKSENCVFVCSNWFPAAHFDQYVARPLHRNIYVAGSMVKSHKYAWINELNGPIQKGINVYLLANSRYPELPMQLPDSIFEHAGVKDSIAVMRCGSPAAFVFVRKMTNAKRSFLFTREGGIRY